MSLRRTILSLAFFMQFFNVTSAATTPTLSTNFVDNFDGTVTQLSTDLVWKRCAEGQTWDQTNTTCLNTAKIRNYQSAQAARLYAGNNDWRLPTVAELESLVDRTKFAPAVVDTVAFPNFDLSNTYWTSTGLAERDLQYYGPSGNCFPGNENWLVDFKYGFISTGCTVDHSGFENGLEHSVRVVREGKQFASNTESENAVYDDLVKVLTIKDAQIGNGHYRLRMQSPDLNVFTITSMLLLPQAINNNVASNVYIDSKTKTIVIPRVKAFNAFFSVTFNDLGNQAYQLDKVSVTK